MSYRAKARRTNRNRRQHLTAAEPPVDTQRADSMAAYDAADASDQAGTVDVPGLRVFKADSYVTRTNAMGEIEERKNYSERDLDDMVANQEHIVQTGQTLPPVVIEHDGEGAHGFISGLYRRGRELFADLVRVPKGMADKLLSGKVDRSVEVTPDGSAWNYRGTDGCVLKRLAVLRDTLPKIKTLNSTAYAEAFGEAPTDGYRIRFAEDTDMIPESTATPAAPAADTSGPAATAALLERLRSQGVAEEDLALIESLQPAGAPAGIAAAEDDPMPLEDETTTEEEEDEETDMEAGEFFSELDAALARAAHAETQAAALLHRERQRSFETFAETCVTRYGPARAKDLVGLAASRVQAIPLMDSFSEGGQDRTRIVLDDILRIAGPATVHDMPGALTERTISDSFGESFSEDAVRRDYLNKPGATAAGAETAVKLERQRWESRRN